VTSLGYGATELRGDVTRGARSDESGWKRPLGLWDGAKQRLAVADSVPANVE
jgi:hypothetical protein